MGTHRLGIRQLPGTPGSLLLGGGGQFRIGLLFDHIVKLAAIQGDAALLATGGANVNALPERCGTFSGQSFSLRSRKTGEDRTEHPKDLLLT